MRKSLTYAVRLAYTLPLRQIRIYAHTQPCSVSLERTRGHETDFRQHRASPRSALARENRDYRNLQTASPRPRRLAQTQFGRRSPGGPQRSRRRIQSCLLLPARTLRLLEARAAQPRLANGHLWGKLHDRRLAGILSPPWRPVLSRFGASGRDAASPPLLQARREIPIRRYGEAIPGQRPDRFLPCRHARGRGRRR